MTVVKMTASQTCVIDAVSEPTCSLNTSQPGHWAHEWDAIEISCTVEYWGSWRPHISCVPDAPVRLIEERVSTFNSTFRRLTYVRVVAAADIADRAVVICDTTFFQPASEKPPEQIDTVAEGPQYHHTWMSSPIHVFNAAGSIDLLRQTCCQQFFSPRPSYEHVYSPVNGRKITEKIKPNYTVIFAAVDSDGVSK